MENFKKYLAEMFGTMFLVLLACGSAVLAGPLVRSRLLLARGLA